MKSGRAEVWRTQRLAIARSVVALAAGDTILLTTVGAGANGNAPTDLAVTVEITW